MLMSDTWRYHTVWLPSSDTGTAGIIPGLPPSISFTRFSNFAIRSKSSLSSLRRRPPCLPLGIPEGAEETHVAPTRTQCEQGSARLHLIFLCLHRLQLGGFVFRMGVRLWVREDGPEEEVASPDD